MLSGRTTDTVSKLLHCNREGAETVRGLDKMEITDIRIRRLEGNNKMKAIVSITIDDEFVLHDIKVVDGEKGLFIAMPSKKTADGEYRDIAHPIKTETRNRIQKMILERYEQEQAEALAAETERI